MYRLRAKTLSFLGLAVFLLGISALFAACRFPGFSICGDGACGIGEYPWNCPEDCSCGDGVCRGEDCCTCPEDCHYGDPAMPCLGNAFCDVACGEDIVTAPEDCDRASINPDHCAYNDECRCGDGICDHAIGENCATCPADCNYCLTCGDGVCQSTEDPALFQTVCPVDCGDPCGDGQCNPYTGENCVTCAADCGSCDACGDGVCDPMSGEDCTICPDDCHYGDPDLPCCGNRVCENSEDIRTCPCDCGGDPEDCPPPVMELCGDGVLNPGEECDVENNCYMRYYGTHRDFQYRSFCEACQCVVPCDHDGVCEPEDFEDCRICPDDCVFGDPEAPCCGNGYCDLVVEEDMFNCPEDCRLVLMTPRLPPWVLEPLAFCGNGVVEGDEECETDAECPENSHCSAGCYCVVECQPGDPCYSMGPGYPCTAPDGSSGICEWNRCDCVVPACGNGVLEAGEGCETTANCPLTAAFQCIDCQCTIPPSEPSCGNGILEAGEACESDAHCPVTGAFRLECVDCQCVPPTGPICGNGVLEPGEACETVADCPVTAVFECRNCQCVVPGAPPPEGGEERCATDEDCWDVPGQADDWVCRDGTCYPPCNFNGECERDFGENVSNCSEDCATCGDGIWSPLGGEECEGSQGCGACQICVDCVCEPDPDCPTPVTEEPCEVPCASDVECSRHCGVTTACVQGCCVCGP